MSFIDDVVNNWIKNGKAFASTTVSTQEGIAQVVKHKKSINISIGSRVLHLDEEWFQLQKHFNVMLPFAYGIKKYENIKFKTLPSATILKTLTSKVMVFKEPITILDKYRIIPGLTDYAVSDNGGVVKIKYEGNNYSMFDLEPIKQILSSSGYYNVEVYNNDKSKRELSRTVVHRLVALAWLDCWNNDFTIKYYVNHKDGVKTNNHYSNLEWITPSDNNHHSFKSGLRTDNEEVVVLDCLTGELVTLHSQGEAARFMGIEPQEMSRLFIVGSTKTINSRYKFKKANDPRELTMATEVNQLGAGEFRITVTFDDGVSKVFNTVKELRAHFKLTLHANAQDTKTHLEKLYPTIKITIEGEYKFKGVQVYELATGKAIETSGMKEASRVTNKNFSVIQKLVNSGSMRHFQGYIYRFKSDEPWDLTCKEPSINQPKRIEATKLSDKSVQIFQSAREAEAVLKIARKTITAKIDSYATHGGYSFKTID